MISKLRSSLTIRVEAEQNDAMGGINPPPPPPPPKQMVLHIRRVLEHSKENYGLRGGSMELCSRGGLLGVHLRVSQCPISVRNEKAYEYISMDNIQLV